ncbi:MAG: hypothetical protein KF894_22885 [Labilithrix sp.]|nr:hypothetical protein [Labilithrix sp.]
MSTAPTNGRTRRPGPTLTVNGSCSKRATSTPSRAYAATSLASPMQPTTSQSCPTSEPPATMDAGSMSQTSVPSKRGAPPSSPACWIPTDIRRLTTTSGSFGSPFHFWTERMTP